MAFQNNRNAIYCLRKAEDVDYYFIRPGRFLIELTYYDYYIFRVFFKLLCPKTDKSSIHTRNVICAKFCKIIVLYSTEIAFVYNFAPVRSFTQGEVSSPPPPPPPPTPFFFSPRYRHTAFLTHLVAKQRYKLTASQINS